MADEPMKASSKPSGRLIRKMMIVKINVTDLIRRSASRGRKRTTSIPTSGKKVIRLRRWSVMDPCSLYQRLNVYLVEDENGQHDHRAENHCQGVIMELSGLGVAQCRGNRADQLGEAVNNTVDHIDVETSPAED